MSDETELHGAAVDGQAEMKSQSTGDHFGAMSRKKSTGRMSESRRDEVLLRLEGREGPGPDGLDGMVGCSARVVLNALDRYSELGCGSFGGPLFSVGVGGRRSGSMSAAKVRICE